MGSIEQRGDSYRVVWRFNGSKEYTTWPTEPDAERANQIVVAHRHQITAEQVYIAMGVYEASDPEPTTPTMREWGDKWLKSKTRITPGTRARYRQQFDGHIYPTFGDVPIGTITAITVGTWLNHMGAVMGSPKTVTRYYSLLFGALQAAADQGVIPRNPCKATDFVRDQTADDDTEGHQAVYLTPLQYEVVRAAFPSRWHTLLDALSETGCRWGEITALAKTHLVAPTAAAPPKLRVWRAWKRGEGGARYLGTTKGRQKRTMSISHDLYRDLLKLVNEMPADALLFRRPDGTALDYSEMYNDVWVPAMVRAQRCPDHPPANQGEHRVGARGRCRDYGGVTLRGEPCGARVVPDTTRCNSHYGPAPRALSTCGCPGVLTLVLWPSWHDLRHTCAAWLFSDPRMTVLAISRRLGHATLAITSDIYGDLMPDAEETAVDAIADARRAGRAAYSASESPDRAA